MKEKMTKMRLQTLISRKSFSIIRMPLASLLILIMLVSSVSANTLSKKSIKSCDTDTVIKDQKKDVVKSEKSDWYYLPANTIQGLPEYIIYDSEKMKKRLVDRVVGIKHSRTETFVDFVMRPVFDSWWCIFTSRTFLKDKLTNDMYQIRRVENNVPLDRFLVIKGHQNSYVTFTLVFPRLAKNVKTIDFIEHKAPGLVYPPNASRSGFTYYDIDVKELEESVKTKYNIIK